MTVENLSGQRKAKIKFFAVYALSVLFIIAITASLWRNNAASAEMVNPIETEERGDSQVQEVDHLLHGKLKELDNLYKTLTNNSSKANEYLPLIQASENSFSITLDSVTAETRNITSEQERQGWNTLLANFKNELQSRSSLYNSYLQLLSTKPSTLAVTNSEEVQQLKASLEDKERSIASLQAELREKPSPVIQNNSGALNDLQDKLAKSKTANEKLQNQINAMKQSYQTVVEDNRRLLTQLQSSRKQ